MHLFPSTFKTLIKRILPLIKDHVYRWDVWCAIFAALPLLVRKDRDDGEGLLFALFPQFQAHIQNAPIDAILRITNTLVSCEKLNYIFTNKVSGGITHKRPKSIIKFEFSLFFLLAVFHIMRHRVAAKNRNGICDIIECDQRQTTSQLD